MSGASDAEYMTRADADYLRGYNLDLREANGRLGDELATATALLRDLHEWALDACHQGAGEPFQASPTWHMFMSTWEHADELLPQVAEWLTRHPANTDG